MNISLKRALENLQYGIVIDEELAVITRLVYAGYYHRGFCPKCAEPPKDSSKNNILALCDECSKE